MPRGHKAVEHALVRHERNIELGLDPYCHECVSHTRSNGGYGQIKVRGKKWLLHRYVWYLHTGEQPENVMHLCDNPCCLNLAHLRAGTIKDNAVDKMIKNRARGGREFSEEDALKIRAAAAMGQTQASLSVEFETTNQAISNIVTGKTYKNVGGPLKTAGRRSLSVEDTEQIRALCKNGAKQTDVAKLFSVPFYTISLIVLGKTYKDV